jgi:hypothetical protein
MLTVIRNRALLLVLALLIGGATRADEPQRSHVIAVPGTAVTDVWVRTPRSVLVLTADQQRRIGRLIDCRLSTNNARLLYEWPGATNGMVSGSALDNRMSVVPITGPGLSLANAITPLEVSDDGATAKTPLQVDVDGRVFVDIFAVKSGLLGVFGNIGTSRLCVESLGSKTSLLEIPDTPGNPATSVIDISPDGRFLLVGVDRQTSYDTELQCWSLSEGKLKWSVKRPKGGTVSALCFTGPDRVTMGTSLGVVETYDCHNGQLLYSVKLFDATGEAAYVRKCVSTANGATIAVWHGDQISLIDLSKRQRRELVSDTKHISCIALERRGEFIAVGKSSSSGCRLEVIEVPK